MKRMKKKNPLRLLHIAMVLCAAGMVFSALFLLSDRWENARGDAAYERLRKIRGPSVASSFQPGGSSDPVREKPNLRVDAIDFTSLEKINPDFTAWLSAEGTPVDYPVVRGKDNRFYLEHLFTGERGSMGSVFMDYRCRSDFSARNTILYGHNMKNGSMFASLEKYKKQSYYNQFPTMKLAAPGGNFTIELFAGTVIDGSREAVPLDLENRKDFLNYIALVKRESTFQSDITVEADDRIVTLCTCTYEFNDARYALFGRLTPAS